MSVLIKGMKMPPTCSKCPMCREDDLGVVYSYCTGKLEMIDGFGLNGRMDFCPLIEVPTPHGGLIDADALEHDLVPKWNCLDDADFANKAVWNTLKEAQTVIEAEE